MTEHIYETAREARLLNRRIRVAQSVDKEEWIIWFKRLSEDRSVETSSFKLSDEDAAAMVSMIMEIVEEGES